MNVSVYSMTGVLLRRQTLASDSEKEAILI